MGAAQRGEAGLKAIIAWKAARAVASVVGAVVLGVLLALGADAAADQLVAQVHAHAVNRVSLELSTLALKALEPRHVHIAIAGLLVDGVVVALEGWSLHKRWWWGPWLVVAATAGLLPFELVSLIRHPNVVRAVLLALNLVIVAYMVSLAWRHHQERVRSTLRNAGVAPR